MCFLDYERGIYSSLDECIDRCERVNTSSGGDGPVKEPDDPVEDSAQEDVIDSTEDLVKGKKESKEKVQKTKTNAILEADEAGVCKSGYYWCEKRGCIPLEQEC